ncbi:MAG: glutamate--tRNA ligase, partial [Clostridia bacterium]|nr:glutamate--tRNA ligase [Clostridia bacterium]
DKNDVKAVLKAFAETYDEGDDQTAWFEKCKDIAESVGYARETKLYRKNPQDYKGHVGDVASFIRVAVTGRLNSPDLYEVIKILGADRMKQRIDEELELIG